MLPSLCAVPNGTAGRAIAGGRCRAFRLPSKRSAHPRHVFLATGRQGAHHAEAAPQHHYLVRSVDPVKPPLALDNVDYVLERGPFTLDGECDLLRQHDIDVIVAKNSGGAATYAKIEAACLLGIEVMMVARARPRSSRRSTLSRRRWR